MHRVSNNKPNLTSKKEQIKSCLMSLLKYIEVKGKVLPLHKHHNLKTYF
jgi:hypothetical protein